MVALAQLIPLPILDGIVENAIRRRLTRVQLASYELDLPAADVRMLADSGAGGCLGFLWSLIVWPFKKVLRTVLFVLQINAMVNVFSDVVHRALLQHEALEMGLLPGDSTHVRAAMNRALQQVDTRVVERGVGVVLKMSRRALMQLAMGERIRIREEVRTERAEAAVSDADTAPLHAQAETITEALKAAVQVPGVQDDLLRHFAEEVGADRAA